MYEKDRQVIVVLGSGQKTTPRERDKWITREAKGDGEEPKATESSARISTIETMVVTESFIFD